MTLNTIIAKAQNLRHKANPGSRFEPEVISLIEQLAVQLKYYVDQFTEELAGIPREPEEEPEP